MSKLLKINHVRKLSPISGIQQYTKRKTGVKLRLNVITTFFPERESSEKIKKEKLKKGSKIPIARI